MTEIAETYLGNIHSNPELAKLAAEKNCLEISLSPSDRTKGRIYACTDSGMSVGIVKSRDRAIQTGDLFQTNSDKYVLIYLPPPELLVLDLASVDGSSPVQLVQLGHILGNHHYPIMVQENKIYVELVTDKSVLEKLLDSIEIPQLKISYQIYTGEQPLVFSRHTHLPMRGSRK